MPKIEIHYDNPRPILFNAANMNWHPNMEMNHMFLRAQTIYFSEKLQVRGLLFLNEVLTDLGFSPTKTGQVLGWQRFDPDASPFSMEIRHTERGIELAFHGLQPIIHLI